MDGHRNRSQCAYDLSHAVAQERFTKNEVVRSGNFDVMLVARHNFHRIPQGFNESGLVGGVQTLLPGVLKRPPQERMLEGLRSLDAPEALTRHGGFDITCCGDAL